MGSSRPIGGLASALAVLLLHDGASRSAESEPPALTRAWELPTPGVAPLSVLPDQRGRPILYMALKNGGVAILDLTAAEKPPRTLARIVPQRLGGLDATHLAQQGKFLFVALGDFFNARGSPAGLAVLDVSQPSQARVLSIWKSEKKLDGAAAVLVGDRFAYLGAMSHGVFIFDLTDLARPKKVAEFLPEVDFPKKNPGRTEHPNARGSALKGNDLYVAYDAGGLRVLDVTTPNKPREIGRYVNAGMGRKQQAFNNVVIDGDTAYVAVDYAGLEVLDIGDPRRIRQVAWWNPWKAQTAGNLWLNSPGHANQIAYDASRRLVYLSAGDSELQVLDVSDRAKPTLVARYGAAGDGFGSWGLAVTPDRVFVSYITTMIPFRSTWSGIKALRR